MFCASPLFMTMMHLCIMLYTYWMPLEISLHLTYLHVTGVLITSIHQQTVHQSHFAIQGFSSLWLKYNHRQIGVAMGSRVPIAMLLPGSSNCEWVPVETWL